ncbi:MAG: CDP-4-dehydro-6-deoxyglucose reductase [Thermoleophilaceae bacterium]|jgi:CDP-6-deoxy-D-xylo-4-hexulose-3-dehydrase|nr:CDP-4-dehydro-6-deoxyglucose reductase [Thermoleophilaceae bacterium]
MPAGRPVDTVAPVLDERIAALIREHFESRAETGGDAHPLSAPLFGAEEVVAAVEVLLSDRVTMGPRVRRFESAFADYVGVRHAVMVNSGSSANLLALATLGADVLDGGLEPGDEVIVPAVTWSTTVAPVLQLGYVPVFVDVDPRTLNMRVEDLEAAVSERTRAIFVVHLLGNPVPMEPVLELAARHELVVLEDSCESLGAEIGGRRVGGIGDAGTFSFYFSHHMTTVEGGMLVTDDAARADLARSIRAHGWSRDMVESERIEAANPEIDPRFLFVHLGYNLRPMEIQAAFGEVQLARLDEYNRSRRENAERLYAALAGIPELGLVEEQAGGRSTWFGFPMLAPDAATRRALTAHLESRGIETRPIVAGNLLRQPAFRDRPHRAVGGLENATAVGERGLFIGNHPGVGSERIDGLAAAVRSFFS